MNNSDFIVMTTAKAKPEKAEDVLQALLDVASAARDQAGCIEYRVFRTANKPEVTVNFERWTSEDERNTFNRSSDVSKFAEAVTGGFAEPPEQIYYQEVG